MILNCWTTFAKKHLVFWSFSTLTCIPHKIKYFIISHTAWPVQFSSAATASADNSWIHKGFSQSSKVYFVIFNILKDVQIIQTIQTFFFFSCGWWHTSQGIFYFISTLHLKDADERQLGQPTLPSPSPSPFVANWLFLPLLRAITLTFGWRCILKLSAEESNADEWKHLQP